MKPHLGAGPVINKTRTSFLSKAAAAISRCAGKPAVKMGLLGSTLAAIDIGSKIGAKIFLPNIKDYGGSITDTGLHYWLEHPTTDPASSFLLGEMQKGYLDMFGYFVAAAMLMLLAAPLKEYNASLLAKLWSYTMVTGIVGSVCNCAYKLDFISIPGWECSIADFYIIASALSVLALLPITLHSAWKK